MDHAARLRLQVGDFHEKLMEATFAEAADIADSVVTRPDKPARHSLDQTIDRLVTSRVWGFPLMIALFAVIFWITIVGANYPSAILSEMLLGRIYPALHVLADALHMPTWLSGLLLDGVYLATAWVVSVMLPPMAIFFPLFTLLEDFGYLPRVAFNLDNVFKQSGAHGKQSLSMMMGFGCNAAGIVATRVIDSPRERLIAMITNNFALCNGRWPTQILIASIFIGALVPSLPGRHRLCAGCRWHCPARCVADLCRFLGPLAYCAAGRSFHLQPGVAALSTATSLAHHLHVVHRSHLLCAVACDCFCGAGRGCDLVDRQCSDWRDQIAVYLIDWLNPLGLLLGLNGIILVAYIVAIPANEIVIPTILMLTVLVSGMSGVGEGAGVMFELDSDAATTAILRMGGWTLLTAVNLMLFSLIHNPCSTTLYTMYTESGSRKWTLVAALLPLAMGFAVTFVVAQVWRLFVA